MKQPHPWINKVLIGLISWALFATFLLPYTRHVQDELDLRPSQWAHMENLILLSKANTSKSTSVEVLDEAELQKIRIVLAAKGFKPHIFRLSEENPPTIELQITDVLFPTMVDVLEDLRLTWSLYPEKVVIASKSVVATVNLSAVLRRIDESGNGLNTSMAESSSTR